MNGLETWGKYLMIAGVVLIIIGLIFYGLSLLGVTKFPLGNLPGDFRYQSKNTSFYFPLTSSILVSAVLSLIAYFFRK